MSLVPSWSVVEQFERRVAEYVGAPYAVAVDTCTAGLFLCLEYEKRTLKVTEAMLPRRTYLGVAVAAVHAGLKLRTTDRQWRGSYQIAGGVHDYACRLYKGMFRDHHRHLSPFTFMCLSFQSRKHLKIGRGGMVCTGSAAGADWLRKARFLGRGEHNGVPEFVGWHAFMEPERAARGLVLMDALPDRNDDLVFEYPDLSTYDCLKEYLA